MRVSNSRKLTSTALAAALLVSATAASAATRPSSASLQTASPWMSLSLLSTSSSAGAATSAAAAQGEDSNFTHPPIAPLLVILATLGVMIYIALKDDDSDHRFGSPPVSPT